jgi:hypothetical protein
MGANRVFLSPSIAFAPRVRPWETNDDFWQRDTAAIFGTLESCSEGGSASCPTSIQTEEEELRYLCAKSPRPGTIRTYAGAPGGGNSPCGKRARCFPTSVLSQTQSAGQEFSAFMDATSSQGTGSISTAISFQPRVYRSQRVSTEADLGSDTGRLEACFSKGSKRRRIKTAASAPCRTSWPVPDMAQLASWTESCASIEHDVAPRRHTGPRRGLEPLDALLARETGSLRGSVLRKATLASRFRCLRLRQEYDANCGNMSFTLPLLRRRASVVEIVAVDDIVFTLTANGICTAFNAVTQKHLCCLNQSSDEVVRSIFLNKANHALITVSVRHEDRFLRLRCRSTPIEAIYRGQPESGFPLFTSECLSWPGFVEFDDVNAKVLTFSASDRSYTVWDLATYRRLYRIACRSIAEIKVSPGMMLLIHHRVGSHVPLQFVEIETGIIRRELFYLLNRSRKIEFIELFHDKLLVKQEGVNLRIVDLQTNAEREVPSSQHMTPNHFIFLYETKLFLLFRDQEIQVWDFLARRVVPRLTKHALRVSTTPTNTLYISAAQDILVSYRTPPALDDSGLDADTLLERPSRSLPGTTGTSSNRGLRDSSPLGSSDEASERSDTDASHLRFRECSKFIHQVPDSNHFVRGPAASCPVDDRGCRERYDAHSGSIWITHIPTGTCVGCIRAQLDSLEERRALSDVTAIFYHEDRNEIYTANRSGLVHRWSV